MRLNYVVCALFALGCSSSSPRRPIAPALPEAKGEVSRPSCSSEAERADALTRYRRGEWFGALRRFERARERCPASHLSAEETQLLRVLSEPKQSPGELLDAARLAATAGKLADAQLLEDRAAFALEAETGGKVGLAAPLASQDAAHSFWLADSRWLLTRDASGLSLRERDSWYPRYFQRDLTPPSYFYNVALASDGKTLLSLELPTEVDRARLPALRAFDVRAGAGFGSELMRVPAHPNSTPRFVDVDRIAFVEGQYEPTEASWLALFSLSARQVLYRVKPDDPKSLLQRFIVSPDGKRACLQWSDHLSFVDLATGKARHLPGPGPSVPIMDSMFSPDGRYAVWRDYEAPQRVHLAVYDTQTESLTRRAPAGCDAEHGFVFDDASTTVAVGSPRSQVCLLTLANGRSRSLIVKDSTGTTPLELLADGALWVHAGEHNALLSVTSGRELARVPHALGLLYVDQKPTLISRTGTLTVIEPSLGLRHVDPSPRPSGWISGATRLGRELALRFDDGSWLIADSVTGRTRPLEMPRRTDVKKSPDNAFLASDAAAPALIDVATGKPASRSPKAFAGADLAQVMVAAFKVKNLDFEAAWQRGQGLSRPALVKAPSLESVREECFGSALVESSGRVGIDVERTESGSVMKRVDCESGARGPRVQVDGSPVMVGSPTRVVGYGPGGVSTAHIWDISTGKVVAKVELDRMGISSRGVLSPDDRYWLTDQYVWDVAASRKLQEVGYLRDKPGFLSNGLVVIREQEHLALLRAPTFARVGAIVMAADLSGAVVFAIDAGGRVTALEVLGDEAAFDTTFACGIETSGVPFRICRQALERPGLLEELMQ